MNTENNDELDLDLEVELDEVELSIKTKNKNTLEATRKIEDMLEALRFKRMFDEFE